MALSKGRTQQVPQSLSYLLKWLWEDLLVKGKRKKKGEAGWARGGGGEGGRDMRTTWGKNVECDIAMSDVHLVYIK